MKKKSEIRANSTLGRVLRPPMMYMDGTSVEYWIETILSQLIKSKCMPVLLHAVEASPANRSLQGSLEFPFTGILMKILRTRSHYCYSVPKLL